MTTEEVSSHSMTALTSGIVSAYVSHNAIQPAGVPSLMREVFATLTTLGVPPKPAALDVPKPSAAEIRRSITPDALISFVDGHAYKTLRRHLRSTGRTPESYRKEFGLPADYPMVCTNYSAERSDLAKRMGLGSMRSRSTQAA